MFFFNDTATTEIYTLSLHDALPIYLQVPVSPTYMGKGAIPEDHPLYMGIVGLQTQQRYANALFLESDLVVGDRKSTRLNSSHANISYAVFCLKKKERFFLRFPPLLS